MNPKYKVAEIAIELKEDGVPTFWVFNGGYHPSQGGMEFGWGNMGTNDLENAIDMLKIKLTRDLDVLLEEVKKKEIERNL